MEEKDEKKGMKGREGMTEHEGKNRSREEEEINRKRRREIGMTKRN